MHKPRVFIAGILSLSLLFTSFLAYGQGNEGQGQPREENGLKSPAQEGMAEISRQLEEWR